MWTLLKQLSSLFLFIALSAPGSAAERGPEKISSGVWSKSLGLLDAWAAGKRGCYGWISRKEQFRVSSSGLRVNQKQETRGGTK